MKILILANNDLGLYRFRKDLIEEYIRQKNNIYISLPNGELVKSLVDLGCTFIDTPIDRRGINPITDASLLRHYRKIIHKIDPDLVICYTIKPNIYGGIVSRFEKKNYAINITGLGTAFERSKLLKIIVVALYRIAMKRAKVVFVENSEIREKIIDLKLCKREKVVVLNGAGVNTEEFYYMDYPNNNIVHFLFVGRIMKEKGIEELLSAMQRLIREGYECFLDIVGPFEEDYGAIFEKHEKEGWMKYHGYKQDVRPYIQNCDCFVLPSYHEGMANTNLECASCGRPIITSDIPGCRESVIENQTGFLCEAKNEENLYYKMKELLSLSVEERKQLGKNGRLHMKDTFEKKIIVEKTIKEIGK